MLMCLGELLERAAVEVLHEVMPAMETVAPKALFSNIVRLLVMGDPGEGSPFREILLPLFARLILRMIMFETPGYPEMQSFARS